MAIQYVLIADIYYISHLQMYYIYIGVIIIICLIFIIHNKNKEKFTPASDHPSKCFSCSSQYPPQSAWRGAKTKCFSCLRQAYELSGGNECAAFHEQPIRYYEMPPIPGMGYPKMGYMG